MDKEDVVYTHNGILLIHKMNEILPFAATKIDLKGIMLSEISQRKTNTIWYHLYVESEKVKYMKTESKMVFTIAGGVGK